MDLYQQFAATGLVLLVLGFIIYRAGKPSVTRTLLFIASIFSAFVCELFAIWL